MEKSGYAIRAHVCLTARDAKKQQSHLFHGGLNMKGIIFIVFSLVIGGMGKPSSNGIDERQCQGRCQKGAQEL